MAPQKKTDSKPSNTPHPFEKPFAQIEALLKLIQDNKHKVITHVPEWILEELERLQNKFLHITKAAERSFPDALALTDEQTRQFLASIPEEGRTKDIDIIEKAYQLKLKVQQARDEYFNLAPVIPQKKGPKSQKSPLNFLTDQEKARSQPKEHTSPSEHTPKFGRVSSRKNWRPM